MMKKKLFSELPTLTGDGITLRPLNIGDTCSLKELTEDNEVYRYLPTFLFEKKYENTEEVICRMYDEGLKESIILGIFRDGAFCGLAEMYGYRDDIHKISVGYRLIKRWWGKGIAKKALGLMISYLNDETDIEIITASSMVENKASAAVLRKNNFILVTTAKEDWGYDKPISAHKWIR
ncbi:GNAT family N-acetyltransferase [Ruminococcus sp.]|uniref:GNAT family N-acetyltransferase n=1 Tax=Ruminococcus sp. TaxID=41978 RepID=UPI002E7994DE|nr:GNAT family N-acetyltransferase [Ruminococcus sp.]